MHTIFATGPEVAEDALQPGLKIIRKNAYFLMPGLRILRQNAYVLLPGLRILRRNAHILFRALRYYVKIHTF